MSAWTAFKSLLRQFGDGFRSLKDSPRCVSCCSCQANVLDVITHGICILNLAHCSSSEDSHPR